MEPQLEQPGLGEQYISAVLGAGGLPEETYWICLVPWSSGTPRPASVIIPDLAQGRWTEAQITDFSGRSGNVLIVCTFENPEEERVLENILPPLKESQSLCLLILHIVPRSECLTRDGNEAIMQRHLVMLNSGVDDVLFNPSCQPRQLQHAVDLAVTSSDVTCERMRSMIDEIAAEDVTQEQLDRITRQKDQLLWENIPRALMPHFPELDRSLQDRGDLIGNYRLIRKYVTRKGVVAYAQGPAHRSVSIKVVSKPNVTDPGELECIYREFRFTSSIIRHQNVVSCIEMLHSEKRLYLVFETAGQRNLQQHLADIPTQNLPVDTAISWWRQIMSGIAACHAQDIAHRRIALGHVVINDLGNDEYVLKIIDFRDAMLVRGSLGNRSCGNMPCMAPEMAFGAPYDPMAVDGWSAGIVLLEAAGGLGSTLRAVAGEANMPTNNRAQLIRDFFLLEGSHARALACMNQVENDVITRYLQQVLQPNPAMRSPLEDVLGPE